jgi:hypothetical protein
MTFVTTPGVYHLVSANDWTRHRFPKEGFDGRANAAAVIPAKRSASRDRKKLGISICYDPG